MMLLIICVINSNHNSELEQNVSETDESDTESSSDNGDDINSSKFLYGKNKFKWSVEEFSSKIRELLDTILLLNFLDCVTQLNNLEILLVLLKFEIFYLLIT